MSAAILILILLCLYAVAEYYFLSIEYEKVLRKNTELIAEKTEVYQNTSMVMESLYKSLRDNNCQRGKYKGTTIWACPKGATFIEETQ